MKTEQQALDEQKKLHPLLKAKGMETVITMIVPGRRALGETWTKVRIGHDGNEIVVGTEATEAPEGGRPVMAMSGADAEYTNYILEAAAEKARARGTTVQGLTQQERYAAAQEAWSSFVEQKLRHLKGQSTFGLGGSTQRQRVNQNPANRPALRK